MRGSPLTPQLAQQDSIRATFTDEQALALAAQLIQQVRDSFQLTAVVQELGVTEDGAAWDRLGCRHQGGQVRADRRRRSGVSAFVQRTDLALIVCASAAEAELLEKRLKAEFLPPPTKR